MSQDCPISPPTFQQVVLPPTLDGQRAPGLRFGDPGSWPSLPIWASPNTPLRLAQAWRRFDLALDHLIQEAKTAV